MSRKLRAVPSWSDARWRGPTPGKPPWPLPLALAFAPFVAAWTLPQTLAGLVFAAVRRAQGHPVGLYRFGPFVYVVVPSEGVASAGISLGVVVFAVRPEILTHELCHLYTGLWLSWAYLPVYGLEYLLLGHERSWHERLTCRFEKANKTSWVRLGG